MPRFVLSILLVSTFMSLITYLLGRISNQLRLVKYLPSFISLGFAIYSLYLARAVKNGFEDLAFTIIAVICFFAGIISFITALLLDYFKPNKK